MLLAIKKDGKFVKVFGVEEKPYQAEVKAKDWIANEQYRHPNSTYKLFAWYGDITDLLDMLFKSGSLNNINWAWDNKKFGELLDYDEDIT